MVSLPILGIAINPFIYKGVYAAYKDYHEGMDDHTREKLLGVLAMVLLGSVEISHRVRCQGRCWVCWDMLGGWNMVEPSSPDSALEVVKTLFLAAVSSHVPMERYP